MNNNMRQNLEIIINSIVNDDSKQFTDAFQSYLTDKLKQMFEDISVKYEGLKVWGDDGDYIYIITDLPAKLTQQEFNERLLRYFNKQDLAIIKKATKETTIVGPTLGRIRSNYGYITFSKYVEMQKHWLFTHHYKR